MKFRTQWSVKLSERETVFPVSIVQSGMSPSISQMVKSRTVGGDTSSYEMDGISEDAPFDTEYPDRFEVQDFLRDSEAAALQRWKAEEPPANNAGEPPQTEGSENQ